MAEERRDSLFFLRIHRKLQKEDSQKIHSKKETSRRASKHISTYSGKHSHS